MYVWLSCRAVILASFLTIRGGGPGIIDVAMISEFFSSLRHTVYAFSVLRSPLGQCLLSAGFALRADRRL